MKFSKAVNRRYFSLRQDGVGLILAFFLSIAASGAKAEGTTYYISSSLGSDLYDGLSPEKPWKTIGQIDQKNRARTFKPGDQILLRRGDRWEGQIVWTEGPRSIRIGAYGEGNLPALEGEGVSLVWKKTPIPEVWSARLGPGEQIFLAFLQKKSLRRAKVVSGQIQKEDELTGALKRLEPSTYFERVGAPSELFVRLPPNHSPTDLRIFRKAGVVLSKANDLIVENIQMTGFGSGVDLDYSKNVTVQSLKISEMLSIGIYARLDNEKILIQKNEIFNLANNGVYIKNSRGCVVKGNQIHRILPAVRGLTIGGDKAGIGLQESRESLVVGNSISFVKAGLDFYFEENSEASDNFIFHATGLGTPHGTSLRVHHNTVHMDPPNYGNGVNVINTGKGRIEVNDNIFYGVHLYGLQTQTDKKNGEVLFRGNVVYGTRPKVKLINYPAFIQSTKNCFFSEVSSVFVWDSKVAPHLAPMQKEVKAEAGSVFASPGWQGKKLGTAQDFKFPKNFLCENAGVRPPWK